MKTPAVTQDCLQSWPKCPESIPLWSLCVNFSPEKGIVHFYTVAIVPGKCRNNIKICCSEFIISSDMFQSDPYSCLDHSSSNPMQSHLNSAVLYRFTLRAPREAHLTHLPLKTLKCLKIKTKTEPNLQTLDYKIKTFRIPKTKGPDQQSCWSPAITIYHSVMLDCDRLNHGRTVTDSDVLAVEEAPQ